MFIGYLFILLSAAGFGVTPIFALYSYESGVTVSTLLFLRFSFASLLLFLYAFCKIKTWTITKSEITAMFLLGGILFTVQSAFYFLSVQYIPVSLAVLLVYLYPILVSILSFFINREPISPAMLASIAISLLGMSFVLGSPSGKVDITGVLLAVGAAIVYAFFVVVGNRVTRQIPSIITSAFITLSAACSFFIWGMASDSLHFDFQSSGWWSILGVVVFSTVLSMLTLFAGMNITGPTKASILSMVEPLITILLSVFLLDEKMSVTQMIGGGIILGGALIVVLSRERLDRAVQAKDESVR